MFNQKNSGSQLWLALILATIFGNASADSAASRAVEAHQFDKKSSVHLLGGVYATTSKTTVLPEISAKELAALNKRTSETKVYTIGVGRTLDKQQTAINLDALTWVSTTGGKRYATVEYQSRRAAALRLAIDPAHFPKGLSLTVYGLTMPETLYGPYRARDLRTGLTQAGGAYWLPTIEGDTARIELQLDAEADVSSQTLLFPLLSHLITSPHQSSAKRLSEIGDSGNCNIDIACPPSDPTWFNRGQSVAKYLTTDSTGATGFCTGTLLNNTSNATVAPPYFITANHCVDTVGEAQSMDMYWFFQLATCGGLPPTTVAHTSGGATLLTTSTINDATLVRLNVFPPSGAVYAAWSSDPVTVGAILVALHHPSGDLKKYSSGTMQGFSGYLNGPTNTTSHIRMIWNAGTTEGGSSGSGLFDSVGQLVGTLHGGDAACGINQTQPDWYGRFEQAYPSMQLWLNPSGPPPPVVTPPSSTLLSSGTTLSGSIALGATTWYRIISDASHTTLTVTLTTQTGDADLRVYRDSITTATCTSDEAGTIADSCPPISTLGVATWYVAVDGFAASTYGITATLAPSSTPAPSAPPDNGGGGGSLSAALLALLTMLVLMRALSRKRMRIVTKH